MNISRRHLSIWPVIPSNCWMSTMISSRNLRDWLLSGMTKPVVWALSTRQEGNYSVTKIEQCTNCHPPRMLCCRMPDAQCIKQEFGQPTHKQSLWSRLHGILPRLRYHSHGYQFGWQFKRFSHRAGNKCSCKGVCSNCSCGKANLDCSPFCKCNCTAYNITNCVQGLNNSHKELIDVTM